MNKTAILFTGSGSTGKTSLLLSLQEHFQNGDVGVSVITEFVRELKNSGVISTADIVAKDNEQMIISAEQFLRYVEVLNNKETSVIIAERTPIDTLSYAINSRCNEYTVSFNKRYLEALFSSNNVTFLVFYFPPIIPFQQDEIRIKSGRDAVDATIQQTLAAYKIPYITMIEGSVEQRKEFVLKEFLLRSIGDLKINNIENK